MIEEIRNNVEQFLHRTDYNTSVDTMIRAELIGLGIISGENNMKWETPNREYTIDISREDGQLWMDDTRFIMILKFFNNIGVNLAEVRFNEIFMVELLYRMILFFTDMIGPFDLYCETYNLTMESYIFRFNRTSPSVTVMELWRYSKISEYQSRIVRIEMSNDKYTELTFKLFFATLSDIDVVAADVWQPPTYSDLSPGKRIDLNNKISIIEEFISAC